MEEPGKNIAGEGPAKEKPKCRPSLEPEVLTRGPRGCSSVSQGSGWGKMPSERQVEAGSIQRSKLLSLSTLGLLWKLNEKINMKALS